MNIINWNQEMRLVKRHDKVKKLNIALNKVLLFDIEINDFKNNSGIYKIITLTFIDNAGWLFIKPIKIIPIKHYDSYYYTKKYKQIKELNKTILEEVA